MRNLDGKNLIKQSSKIKAITAISQENVICVLDDLAAYSTPKRPKQRLVLITGEAHRLGQGLNQKGRGKCALRVSAPCISRWIESDVFVP